MANEKIVGMLAIDSAWPEKYSELDLPVVQAFANHAAIAVVNAELHRQAQVAAVAEERNRIARDLHDAVTQTIFSASLIAEALPMQWDQDEPGARANLARLHQLTRGALAEMRMLLLELRPKSLQQTHLSTLISNLCEAYQVQIGVKIKLAVIGHDSNNFPVDIKEYLYRVTQEALNNVAKHAKASQVLVKLEQTESDIPLSIQDDGQGFDPSQIPPGHLGLLMMQERAAKMNAKLHIESQIGLGTTIRSEWKTHNE